jgi:hypothetical protein
MGGARTSAPLQSRQTHYLKSYLGSLLLPIRNLYLGRNGRPPQGSPGACVYMDSTGCRPNSPCKALGFIPFQGPRLNTLQVRVFRITSGSPLLRRSGRAVYLYSTAHKTQLTILQLEDFLPASLFPDLLPQPIGGFINNIFRELNITTKLIIYTMSPQDPPPPPLQLDAQPGGDPL